MPRATYGSARAGKKRRVRRGARGYFGGRSKLYRTMKPALTRAGQYSYRDRRLKKRDYRGLWIIRLTAACRARGISYSKLIDGLKKACVALNRKMLSELAVADSAAFDKLVALARG